MRVNIEELLPQVEKPARYLGNEWNVVRKDLKQVDVKVALAFPDVYEVAMSHLGLHILYHVINGRHDALAERVYAPWTDMEDTLRSRGLPLFSMESHASLDEFDLVGFTLQYEMSYTNILNMLELAHIPLLAAERRAEDPLIMAGGPCAYNSEPLAPYLDFVVLGEAEETVGKVIDTVKECKARGTSRRDTLQTLAQIAGVYVPAAFEVTYNPDGSVRRAQAAPGFPEQVVKPPLPELKPEWQPDRPLVPVMEIIHDRAVMEVFRGCSRGCRFCQAGMIYRPVRERKPEDLIALARKIIDATGFDEISLSSLSTMDYSELETLIPRLLDQMRPARVGVSLPSLRVDSFSVDIARQVQAENHKSGLTLAPEAGTQRLRDVINKQVTEKDILGALQGALDAGWRSAKLYFMIGLPTETDDDVLGIVDLAHKILALKPADGKGGLSLTISTSSFVPKSWTPFQWAGQDAMADLVRKQMLLKDKLRPLRRVTYHYHDPEVSFLEAVFARGDRTVANVLLKAHAIGCKFDTWGDHFSFDRWMQAFALADVDPTFYANRTRSANEILPWAHTTPGVTSEFLREEWERAQKALPTYDCRTENCEICGVCQTLPVGIKLARD